MTIQQSNLVNGAIIDLITVEYVEEKED